MLGGMQDWPLLVWKLIDHAALNHGTREIVTALVEGGAVDRGGRRRFLPGDGFRDRQQKQNGHGDDRKKNRVPARERVNRLLRIPL